MKSHWVDNGIFHGAEHPADCGVLDQIPVAAKGLHDLIEAKKRELAVLEYALGTIQSQCSHEKSSGEHRGYKIGTCFTCGRKHMSRDQVDQLFSQ